MLLMENGYPNPNLEIAAEKVKRVCPDIYRLFSPQYFAVRDTSHGVIDRFIARDQGPDLLLCQIAELLRENRKLDTWADTPAVSCSK